MNEEKEVMEILDKLVGAGYNKKLIDPARRKAAKSINNLYQSKIDKLKAENESRIIEIMNDINPFSFRTWGEYYKEVAKRIIGGK